MTTPARPLLSICIPCRKRWPEAFGLIAEAQVQLLPEGSVEVCISLSGVEDVPSELAGLALSGVSTQLSGSDVSFGDNLRSSVGMARGEWCVIMGDDDRISASDMRMLIEEIAGLPPEVRMTTLGVIGRPRKNQVPRRSVAMRCGSMSGLLFRRNELLETLQHAEAVFPGSIYPQIWAGLSHCDVKAVPVLRAEVHFGGSSTHAADAFFDHMSRPHDFGVGERLFWAMKGGNEGLLTVAEREILLLNIFAWSQAIRKRLSDSNEAALATAFTEQVRRSGESHCGRRRTTLMLSFASAFLRVQALMERFKNPSGIDRIGSRRSEPSG